MKMVARLLLGLAVIFVLCLSSLGTALAAERCLRVQLDGAIKLRPKNPQATQGQAGNAMLGCVTNGKFRIELIFPEKGGPAISQQNWVAISGFDCSGADCQHRVYDAAFTPRPFSLFAQMKPAGAFSYQVDFLLTQPPPLSPITINIRCQGAPADVSDYGSNYRQLLLPFLVNKMSLTCILNKSNKKHPPKIDLGPFLNADLEWEELTTLVPCKNFQY